MNQKTIIIGYGSRIRGDDAAGLLAAEEIAERRIPGLRVIPTAQLSPEIASEIAGFDRVIFIDSTIASDRDQSVLVRELRENTIPPLFGHAYSPERIVEMANRLYGATPAVWMVTIPGFEFDWKDGLSPATTEALPKAIETILRLIDEGNPKEKAKAAPPTTKRL